MVNIIVIIKSPAWIHIGQAYTRFFWGVQNQNLARGNFLIIIFMSYEIKLQYKNYNFLVRLIFDRMQVAIVFHGIWT